jgi:DNA-directed RNA polymerase specialized sigma24 family protein
MEDEIALSDFCDRVEQQYLQRTKAFLRWHFPGLSREDVDDIWQETVQALISKFRSDPEIGRDGKLGRFVTAIARNKTCDILKRQTRKIAAVKEKTMRDSRSGSPLQNLNPMEREEMAKCLAEACELLSADEKRVWIAYTENYPTSRTKTRLADFAGMPQYCRRAAKLLESARNTILGHLKERGFDFD